MSRQQRLNPFTAGAQASQRVDQVETRQLQAPGYRGIERRGRHDAMVGHEPASVEVQTASVHPFQASPLVQALNLVQLIDGALDASGLTHEGACELMVDEDGKPLDPSQWNRMRRTGNLPIGRMRNLPIAFWWSFISGLAEPAQMNCSHADMADLAVMKVALAMEEVAHAFRSMRRRA